MENFADPRSITLWLKLGYAAFVAILVPVYWRYYGAGNFLWFSDLALFITLAAVWLESSLLASTQALSVGLLELVWLADFLIRLTTGVTLVGLSSYMFDPRIPLPIRGLSLFHAAMPFLLFWLMWNLGYDPRALFVQTAFAWIVLPLCYTATRPRDNVNWVFGPGRSKQRWLASPLYLMLLVVFFPVCIYLPTHFVLWRLLTSG
jgi:hypothetical protein